MANTNSNYKDKHIWQVFAPQINHIFGYFETLKEARKAARLLYEPEMREDLSFFKYREKDGTEVYEILSEPLQECYMDPAEIEIRQITLGEIKPYTASNNSCPSGQQELRCYLTTDWNKD